MRSVCPNHTDISLGGLKPFDQLPQSEGRARENGQKSDGRRECQHRKRAQSLADRTAQCQNRTDTHQGGACDLAAQLARVFAGFPTEVSLDQRPDERTGDDTDTSVIMALALFA